MAYKRDYAPIPNKEANIGPQEDPEGVGLVSDTNNTPNPRLAAQRRKQLWKIVAIVLGVIMVKGILIQGAMMALNHHRHHHPRDPNDPYPGGRVGIEQWMMDHHHDPHFAPIHPVDIHPILVPGHAPVLGGNPHQCHRNMGGHGQCHRRRPTHRIVEWLQTHPSKPVRPTAMGTTPNPAAHRRAHGIFLTLVKTHPLGRLPPPPHHQPAHEHEHGHEEKEDIPHLDAALHEAIEQAKEQLNAKEFFNRMATDPKIRQWAHKLHDMVHHQEEERLHHHEDHHQEHEHDHQAHHDGDAAHPGKPDQHEEPTHHEEPAHHEEHDQVVHAN